MEGDLLDRLSALTRAQFNAFLLRLGLNTSFFLPDNVEAAARATQLLQFWRGQGKQFSELEAALDLLLTTQPETPIIASTPHAVSTLPIDVVVLPQTMIEFGDEPEAIHVGPFQLRVIVRKQSLGDTIADSVVSAFDLYIQDADKRLRAISQTTALSLWFAAMLCGGACALTVHTRSYFALLIGILVIVCSWLGVLGRLYLQHARCRQEAALLVIACRRGNRQLEWALAQVRCEELSRLLFVKPADENFR